MRLLPSIFCKLLKKSLPSFNDEVPHNGLLSAHYDAALVFITRIISFVPAPLFLFCSHMFLKTKALEAIRDIFDV